MSIIMDGSDPLVFKGIFKNGIRELTWPKTMMLKTAHIDSDVFELVDNKIQAESEWSGKGLPPIGVDCEWKGVTRNGWIPVSIIAHAKDDGSLVAIAQAENEVILGASDRFRRGRTTDQIAAEKRDAAIKEMQRLVGSCNTFPFADLYDYGYRLQVAE